MGTSIIRYYIGQIIRVEALFFVLCFLVSLYYQEGGFHYLTWSGMAGVAFLLGSALSFKRPPKDDVLRGREGMVVVAAAWIILSVIGATPFVILGEIPSFVDAFFETASGFTTTGSSILNDLSVLSRSAMFWRSFTHLVGGMGVLVFTLALLPKSSVETIQLMRAEVPGPSFGKLVSQLAASARLLYLIYLSMTAALIIILVVSGVPLYDASLLAFGTAGTGGFSILNEGFANYPHPAFVEYVLALGMLVFSVNFNLYYGLLIKHFKEVYRDEELRAFLLIVVAAVAVIVGNVASHYESLEEAFRTVFFTVSSIISTTGFSIDDFNLWPLSSHLILLSLMFIGGCAGSTAGGLKVSRIVMMVKAGFCGFRQAGHANRVVVPQMNRQPISFDQLLALLNYLMIYVFLFCLGLFSVSFEADNFMTAFSSVAATFNNIGPGLGAVGPAASFAAYSNWNKIVLSLLMIAGRLELLPMIVLFSPAALRALFLDQPMRY